jgi:hypothetical protein
MLEFTGWALATWGELTALLGLAVGVAWLLLGTASVWFWLIVAAVVLLDLFLARQLVREWGYEARYHWWWA